MKIKTKLSLWSVGSILFILAISLVSWLNIKKMIESNHYVFHTSEMIQHALILEKYLSNIESEIQNCVLFKEQKNFDSYYKTHDNINNELNIISQKVVTASQKELIRNIQSKVDKWYSEADKFIETLKSDNYTAPGIEEIGKIKIGQKYLDTIKTEVHNFHVGELTLMGKRRLAETITVENTFIALTAATLLIMLLFSLISFLISSGIRNPLKLITKKIKNILEGQADLTNRISYSKNDELKELVNCFNSFLDSHREHIVKLKHEALELEKYSSSLSNSSTNLANDSVSNSSSISHMTSAMEDLRQTTEVYYSETTKTLTVNEKNVSYLLSKTDFTEEYTLVEAINDKLKSVSDLLMEMNSQTYEIEEFIKNIKEIAIQSRILSVNASVQASKAGEHGKGFAVIADEIKNLSTNSERSIMNALKTYKQLLNISQQSTLAIESTQSQILSLLNKTSEMTKDIEVKTDVLNNITKTLSNLDNSRTRQLEGIRILTEAMGGIKDSTNGNADAARKLQAASVKIMDLCNKLKVSTEDFIT